ncbi:MAG: hypothetical protein IPN44_00750 [Flavobacteriales bacterium]|nr:hypothetical protein [Flavobacteriales bacterium]
MIAENGKKVVYWLGAGASYQALPIVGEMPLAFRSQWRWLVNVYPAAEGTEWLARYRQQMDFYASVAERYGTIDTYARSLFLLKKDEELADLKLHLAMYFLLEQAVEKKDYTISAKEGVAYSKPDQIDKRYMTWLAQVLDNDGMMSKRINILSWNYDLQIEHAIGLYHGLTNLSELHSKNRFTIYPDSTKPDGLTTSVPDLIHLNGIAGHAVIDGTSRALYSSLLLGDSELYIKRLFELYDGYDSQDQWMLRAMQRTFNFAWEESPMALTGIGLAHKCLELADVLVIIGYSFPAFNRSIDIKLMKAFMSPGMHSPHKRIYLQSPSITEEWFGHLFSINNKMVGLKADSTVDQFYLPPELFS